MQPHTVSPQTQGACGFCPDCHTLHHLGMGDSVSYGQRLILRLNLKKNIAFSQESDQLDHRTSTAPLWEEPRGKMFGVLDCRTSANESVQLYAFSGQFNGQWLVDGWVPPLFDVDEFHALNYHREREIKRLTREIELAERSSNQWLELRKIRKGKSRSLMKDIHGLYRLTNFRGETRTLAEAYSGSNNIPTGTGDCCGPKLLNYAAQNGLIPVGICEFFYGKETKSGSHSHGQFSSPCLEKCSPILGFMLCGLEEGKK